MTRAVLHLSIEPEEATMDFCKTTPGRACKIAAALGASWCWPYPHSTVQEARDASGRTVAYTDADGWFVQSALANVATVNIPA